ncbi:type V CRISPR-associated protein Cas12b, partial [Verrucomicrobia bacterium]|nr:type V CRISPR-associated protein Cas12b [Verrucomicrobiota bacterium]
KTFVQNQDFQSLRSAAGKAFTSLREELRINLVALANRVAPLRDRSWEWIAHGNGEEEGLYGELLDSGSQLTPIKSKIRGQRGLSMARIEQLDNLRRLFLRYNRSFDREPEKKAKFGLADFGRRSGEPCPILLIKIDRMKEQRVNQTAHMIVAEALGVRLKQHEIDPNERKERDIHGEYEKTPGRAPVDFIVIENLDRYLTSQGRGPSENSRLMKWSHRAVRDKIKMLAEEPFGIHVLESAAAYSSRFCAITSQAGARCEERKTLDSHLTSVIEKRRDSDSRPGQPQPADFANLLQQFKELDNLNSKLDALRAEGEIAGKAPFSLFLPKQGGPLFLPMDSKKIVQADTNAAINVGLRALAAPPALHLLHKIRVERDGERFQPSRKNAREKAAFDNNSNIELDSNPSNKLTNARSVNFFVDPNKCFILDSAELHFGSSSIRVASGIGLWATVNQSTISNILKINANRLRSFRQKVDDPEDNIPM